MIVERDMLAIWRDSLPGGLSSSVSLFSVFGFFDFFSEQAGFLLARLRREVQRGVFLDQMIRINNIELQSM